MRNCGLDSISRLAKSRLPRQANITAKDCHRDYRRIRQLLIAWLWLKVCGYGQGFGLRVGDFWGCKLKLRLDDLTKPTLPTQPYSASKGDKSAGASDDFEYLIKS